MVYDLSVIIPIYNSEKYLKELFDSLINQNISMEVILINDASTDNSLDIIKKYCTQYSNWWYINNETNKGTNTSRNIGLKKANGKYIIFCDNDDIIPNNIFKKMLMKIKKYDADIITGEVRMVSSTPPTHIDYEHISNNYIWEDNINKFIFKDISSEKIINIKNYPQIICDLTLWNKMFKKELLLNHYLEESFEYKGAEGGIFCIPLLFKSKKIIILNEPVYYWRHHENSLSVKEGLSQEKLTYIFRELQLINEYDKKVGEHYFNMIIEVILPAFLGCVDNYY